MVRAILPLAPVIRALVQYCTALQRRSLHRAWRGVVTLGDFGVTLGVAPFDFFLKLCAFLLYAP